MTGHLTALADQREEGARDVHPRPEFSISRSFWKKMGKIIG